MYFVLFFYLFDIVKQFYSLTFSIPQSTQVQNEQSIDKNKCAIFFKQDTNNLYF